MPDDLAVPQLDGAAVEPAHEPAPATSSSSTQGIRRGDRGAFGWIGWPLVALAAVGMLASTPPSAGPDEPVHAVTAWYVSEHGLPPGSTTWFSVPASLWVIGGSGLNPCYAFHQDVTAGCMPPRSTNKGTVSVSTSRVVDYPPPYYWVVGVGQRLAALVGNEYADIGGRLASLALNLVVLLLLSVYMRPRNPLWGNFLLLVSTPMAVFLGIVVNPSGWEITCALVMAAALSETAWSRQPMGSDGRSKTTTLMLVLASLGLSTARPLGFLWAAGLTVSAIVLAPSMRLRWQLARIVCAVAPGILVGMIWVLTRRQINSSTAVTSSSTILNYVHTFADSLMYFPNRLHTMFGDLGWQDTPMPGLLLYLNIGAWAALLTRLPSIGKLAVLGGVFGILILPSAIEVTGWSVWPLWWQGRYTLPFAAGFVLLLLLRSGRLIPRSVFAVSGIALLSLGLMIWTNAVRYGYGIDGYGLPASLVNPGISMVRLGTSAVIGAILLSVSGYLFVHAWRMKRDSGADLEPQALSSSASNAD